MGKRIQGAKLRAKKRSQAAVEELQEQQAEAASSQSVVNKPNQDLFVLDTTGDTVPQSQAAEKTEKRKKFRTMSEKDKEQVQKLLRKHGKEELESLAQAGQAIAKHNRLRTRGARNKSKADFDLWNDEPSNDAQIVVKEDSIEVYKHAIGSAWAGTAPEACVIKAQKAKVQPKSAVAVDVAKDGQSYRPDPNAHKSIIQKAVDLEMRRGKAIEYNRTPIAQGLSEETKALLVEDTDSEDEESDVENETEDILAGSLPRRTDKLTKAQRNKQRRLRKEQVLLEMKRREKKLMKQVGEVGRYRKELTRAEREKKDEVERQKAEAEKKRPLGIDLEHQHAAKDPISTPTYPVALPNEIQRSSLRTIKPKGSLLTDRMSSFADRGLAEKRMRKEGKKYTHGKRRKLNVKGRKNNESTGATFVVKG
jgi:nucleolar protein 53